MNPLLTPLPSSLSAEIIGAASPREASDMAAEQVGRVHQLQRHCQH